MSLIRTLFVTPEFEDFVRVGGLASVSAALPRAIRGPTDIRLILPGYRHLLSQLADLEVVGKCEAFAQLPPCELGLTKTVDGLPLYIVLCPELYDRPGSPYGNEAGTDWHDNDIRFARFASAAASLAAGRIDRNWRADVVHANDWQSSLVPAYLAWQGIDIPTILTIHNLAYQGLFPKEALRRIGAPESSFHIGGLEFYDKVSFLKAGLNYASHLTTVSETYAHEITSPEFGCGLEGILQQRANAKQLTGILNGIDETWDPELCPQLSSPFAVGDWNGKRENSSFVRKQFKLAVSRGPLFGLVARLVHQKGVDLVLNAAETIVSSGGQIVVMGKGDSDLECALVDLQKQKPESVAVALHFKDDDARRIFAGSDFTLMPSRFEPCGLSQMYAQKFGSLPIGFRTGGLADTIIDGKTGFLFDAPTNESFLGAVCRAFGAYGSRRRLNSMRANAMATSFSWLHSVRKYQSLYSDVITRPA